MFLLPSLRGLGRCQTDTAGPIRACSHRLDGQRLVSGLAVEFRVWDWFWALQSSFFLKHEVSECRFWVCLSFQGLANQWLSSMKVRSESNEHQTNRTSAVCRGFVHQPYRTSVCWILKVSTSSRSHASCSKRVVESWTGSCATVSSCVCG